MLNRKNTVLYIFVSCFLVEATAQQVETKGQFDLNASIKQAIHQYQSGFKKTTHLYSGAEYIRPYPTLKGSPFLDTGGMQKGSIYFDGIYYPDVMLAYDLANQELITTGYQNINLTLVPQKVGYFYLSNRLFIPAPRDSLTNKKPLDGFFEVLYQNDLMVLAYYRKVPKRTINTDSQAGFLQHTSYYILNNKSLIKIENERSLITALAKERESIKRYLHNNNLNFKKAPAETLIKTVTYYTKLKK